MSWGNINFVKSNTSNYRKYIMMKYQKQVITTASDRESALILLLTALRKSWYTKFGPFCHVVDFTNWKKKSWSEILLEHQSWILFQIRNCNCKSTLKNFWKFWNGPLYRNKSGFSFLLNNAACWQSSNTEGCANKLSRILANNFAQYWELLEKNSFIKVFFYKRAEIQSEKGKFARQR